MVARLKFDACPDISELVKELNYNHDDEGKECPSTLARMLLDSLYAKFLAKQARKDLNAQ